MILETVRGDGACGDNANLFVLVNIDIDFDKPIGTKAG